MCGWCINLHLLAARILAAPAANAPAQVVPRGSTPVTLTLNGRVPAEPEVAGCGDLLWASKWAAEQAAATG